MSLRTVGGGASTAASDTVVSTRYVFGPAETDARFVPNTSLAWSHERSFDASQVAYFPKLGHEHDFSKAELEMTGGVMCVKDAWCDTNLTALGAAADTANHDSSHLRVATEQGLTTLRASAFVGFDLSGLPAGASVQQAFLVLRPVAGSEAGAISIFSITSATEGWAEATLVCTNAPAVASNMTTATHPAGITVTTSTASDTAINLGSAAASTYIANRMGTTLTCTFQVFKSNSSTGTTYYFQSKDFPAGSTQFGPRLLLRFTVPA